jgi:hypothetical protein
MLTALESLHNCGVVCRYCQHLLVSCGVRDKIKEYHLSLSSMDGVKDD